MDSKLKSLAKTLYSICSMEKGRVKSPHTDPRDLDDFQSMDEIISHSLKAPNLIRTQTQMGTTLRAPKMESRGFLDESLLKKLLQHRDKIPTSSRVIRSKTESDSSS